MLECARLATQLRRSLVDKAGQIFPATAQGAEQLAEGAAQVPKALRRAFVRRPSCRGTDLLLCPAEVACIPSRKKALRRNQLAADVIRQICEAALHDRSSHESIAERFRVKRTLVGRLVKRYRASDDFIDGLYARE